MINARLSKSVLIILFSLGWAQVAAAHVEGGQAAGFITGLQHPWSGLDHVLAMIAVGLRGAGTFIAAMGVFFLWRALA